MDNGEIFEIEIINKKNNQIIGLINDEKILVTAKDLDSLSIGKKYFGFVYLNRHNEWRATLNFPRTSLRSFGKASVVSVDHESGVFVNIGLVDKDILVSLDDLPDQKQDWPKEGDELIIRLQQDRKNRLWGKLATNEDLINGGFVNNDSKLKRNQMVSGSIYHLGKNGSFILLNEERLAYLYHTETNDRVHLGQKVVGRVIGFGKHNRINISLLKNAYARIDDDSAMILAAIKYNPQKALKVTDKSFPEEIKNLFGISKSSFKRAVGHLLKTKTIVEEDGYLKLKIK